MRTIYIYRKVKGSTFAYTHEFTFEGTYKTCKEAMQDKEVKEEIARKGGKWIASFVLFPFNTQRKDGQRCRMNWI